jgi:hypothetical protein
MREGWAAAWARHLKPGGQLVTLVYPVDPERDDDTGDGPHGMGGSGAGEAGEGQVDAPARRALRPVPNALASL